MSEIPELGADVVVGGGALLGDEPLQPATTAPASASAITHDDGPRRAALPGPPSWRRTERIVGAGRNTTTGDASPSLWSPSISSRDGAAERSRPSSTARPPPLPLARPGLRPTATTAPGPVRWRCRRPRWRVPPPPWRRRAHRLRPGPPPHSACGLRSPTCRPRARRAGPAPRHPPRMPRPQVRGGAPTPGPDRSRLGPGPTGAGPNRAPPRGDGAGAKAAGAGPRASVSWRGRRRRCPSANRQPRRCTRRARAQESRQMGTETAGEVASGGDGGGVFVAPEHSMEAVTGATQRHGDEGAQARAETEGRRHRPTAPALPSAVACRTVAGGAHPGARGRDGEAEHAAPDGPRHASAPPAACTHLEATSRRETSRHATGSPLTPRGRRDRAGTCPSTGSRGGLGRRAWWPRRRRPAGPSAPPRPAR